MILPLFIVLNKQSNGTARSMLRTAGDAGSHSELGMEGGGALRDVSVASY